MKKILFYASDGIGLGHLQRVRHIAQAIKTRNRNIKIILVTTSPKFLVFGRFFHYCIRLIPLSDSLSGPGYQKACLINGTRMLSALGRFQPNIVVADFFLSSNFHFYPLGYALDRRPTKNIFIWRLGDRRDFSRSLRKEAHKLRYFSRILLPHSQEELKYLLPSKFLKKIRSYPKFQICAPIFGKLDRGKLFFCRKKYKIFPEDFLITISFGGGGAANISKCDSPEKILRNFLLIYPRLMQIIPNLKVIITTGPYCRKMPESGFKIPPTLKIVEFEKNLFELIHLSKLVISPASYNICYEILEAKTPAILVPLLRADREQFERAQYFKKKGIAKIWKGDSSGRLLDLIIGCQKSLKKMEANFRKISKIRPGNQMAAKAILKFVR